jgi:tetratricopeptide (TPR) repeat protein
MDFRPQWNYDLMNAGYLLSILGTALLVAGAIVALVRFFRQPVAEWFLILGLVVAFAAGIGLMTLRVASYAQVKAFYALPALFPLCALAAAGWDFMVQKSGVFRPLLRVGFLAWAITVYAAFWIRPGNPFTHTVRGLALADDGRYGEAAENFSRALQLDTNSLPARVGLAEAWHRLGRLEEARQQAALVLQQHPDEAEAHIETALMLGRDRRYAEAVQHLLKAVTQEPDHPTAYEQLAACLAAMGQHTLVIEACEQGLRVDPFNPTLHHSLAIAAAETGDSTNATTHLRLALALKPDMVEALENLAWILATHPSEALRNGAEAVRLAERACKLSQYREPVSLVTLAAAYAEAGRFGDAVKTAEKARDLAAAAGLKDVAAKNSERLELYRAGKPCRAAGAGSP